MRVGIVLPSLSDGDAVGNDAQTMGRVFRDRGYDVEYFAWNSRSKQPIRLLEDLPKMLNSADDVVVYHHSIGCEPGVRAIEKLPARRKAVRYHNVTPPQFFAAINPAVAEGCAQGIKQVGRLARSNAHIWAASDFNARHVREFVPNRKVHTLPPFHQCDALFAAEPDYRTISGLDDWNTNILLVGRVVPNKNIPLAVKAFAEYRARFDGDARLVIVGDRPVPDHAAEVDRLIRDLGQDGHTLLTGHVTTAQLKALYLTADALLVTSLHEGFCVPLVEAMGLRVPMVAVPRAAVPDTAGEAALYAEDDPAALAEQLHRVIGDRKLREEQIGRGWDRYAERFTNDAIARQFDTLVDQLLADE